ncbi:MFS transporter [Crenalkalicoccus roseus]|uniref:MFS transporter n=1 Tax=Crenalkalicoccus roseus TaxID=1485588 RepID=UPI001081467F|nr:MFS transporter [Crenalkalicoccus roseus]
MPAPALPIALFALAGFATGSGMRMLDPLLPLLAADLGVTVAVATGVVAAFVLPYGLVQLLAGPLGDRMGKPRVATLALLVYALAMAACALAPDLPTLIAFRAVSGLCAGAVIPLLLAHLGDTVPYEERQAAIGRFSTGMVMAQLLAGPASGVVAEVAGWRLPFVLLGALALGVGGAMAAWLGPALWRAARGGGGKGSGYRALLGRAAGRRLLLVAFCNGLCLFGGAFPFVGAYLIERFGRGAAEAGLIVAGFGLGALAYTRLARVMVRRFGERGLLLLGGAGLCAGLLGIALAPSWQVVAALQLGLGFAFYLFHGVLQTRATEALPEARGTAVGGFALALFLGQSAGALAFGLVLALAGYAAAFAAAALGVLALALYAARRMGAAP